MAGNSIYCISDRCECRELCQLEHLADPVFSKLRSNLMYRTAAGATQTDVIDPKRSKKSQPGSCEMPASTVFEGLILVDRNFRMAALDAGAGAILGELNERNGISVANIPVPREIL